MRGEEPEPFQGSLRVFGPPPRAWGRGLRRHRPNRDIGSTPTCVGKREYVVRLLRAGAVHPHVRGEERARASDPGLPEGPPPRAWGRAARMAAISMGQGSTPTCVGKRLAVRLTEAEMAVHPHVRGEEGQGAVQVPPARGPPPRAWGRGGARCRNCDRSGSTPTCVGKRQHRPPCGSDLGVHPHVRGEEGTSTLWLWPAWGPPPRAWGRACYLCADTTTQRSTPTCVGKR